MQEKEMEYLTDVLDAARNSGQISDWEANFIKDTDERVEKYGQNTHMSAKQWAVIERIGDKVGIAKDDYVN